jgi:hypothetical protein
MSSVQQHSIRIGALVLLIACHGTCGAAQFSELARYVPASANAIALLDTERLLASPLGARENWKDKYEQAFASGMVTVPPGTERMLLAAEFDYEYMKPRWELAVAELAEARSVAQIARATKGVLDPIGTTPAVALRDDSYLVELAPKQLGAMSPANRQKVSRWVRELEQRSVPTLSPYLQASLAATDKSQIVMAFDLEDAIPPDVIRAKAAASAAVAGKKVDVDQAAKALSSIRGLSLEVAVTGGAYGRLRVHFNDDCAVLTPVALPLLQEILGDLGARIDDLQTWKVTAEAKRITLSGELSMDGMKRVFSLIDNPTSAILATDLARQQPSKDTQVQAYASQQYYKSVNSVLTDVGKESKKATTISETALWLDKWSRRIDRLPILNVDEELTQFGSAVANALRGMAAAIRGVGINSGARTAQIYNSGSVTSDGYSFYAEWRDVDGERRAVRAEERAKGAISAREIAAEIEKENARMRQVMTQKYKLEF